MAPARLRLKVPNDWTVDEHGNIGAHNRWPWEKTGRIHVLATNNVPSHRPPEVAVTIRSLMEEFALPVEVFMDGDSERCQQVLKCIHNVKNGKVLDVNRLVERLNNQRRSGVVGLRPGLVILVSPNDFDPFGRPGENERGIYGESHADGVCVLRCYHEEAVRHELAHMLGLGEHCHSQNCVMRWECPTLTFCPLCVAKIERICQIESA